VARTRLKIKLYRAGKMKGVTMSQQANGPLDVCSSESPSTIRNTVRHQLTSDVAEFLSRGGNVSKIEDNVRADPPKKPSMSYGSAPI